MNTRDQKLLEGIVEMDRKELLEFLEEEYGIDIVEMDRKELLEFLEEKYGINIAERGLDKLNKGEILDYFVDYFRSELAPYLHSECKGGGLRFNASQ
ncbi:MAG TPA: hypothetical protein PKA31_01500 [Candidatus Moranbacteria bacterium]|nr:hypothetical protein [Candidatus Moranbacteria bacterium]